MARYTRRRTTGARRATRGYARRPATRRTYAPRRARTSARSYRSSPQTVRLVIESGPSSLVQRPDGLMASVVQPTDGKAKF